MGSHNGLGSIGIYVAEELERVYQEMAALLGIPDLTWIRPENRQDWTQDEIETFSNCDVILVDGISLADLPDTGANPLIVACGPVRDQSPSLRLKTLPFNLGLEGKRLLMEGRDYTESGVAEPSLDLMLEELRSVLRREVKNYLEFPPIPWGHAYMMTLTHDLDILSLKEMPIARTFLGYFYRSSIVNWKRWRSGKVTTSEFTLTLWEMVRTWAAKIGLGRDVWDRALPLLLDLENRLGVKSSLYFMPFPRKPGILPEALREDKDHRKFQEQDNKIQKDHYRGYSSDVSNFSKDSAVSAPANRASFYDVAKYRRLLTRLEEDGWEAGVHGIDSWYSAQAAREEYKRISMLTGQQELGVRMHWLYFQTPDSFQAMEEGGYLYDTTFGFNEVVGFRAGTLQPYHPLNCQTLWELPLHIQDGALLAEEHLDLTREEAFRQAKPILAWAKRFGGAVSLLWHNQSFTAPRFWGEVYEQLIEEGKQDGAWITIPREVLRWFALRREAKVTLTRQGSKWQIGCNQSDETVSSGPAGSSLPPLRLRLYLDPDKIKGCSVPYEAGEGYVDIPAQPLIILEVEGDEPRC
ncbi:hypothetical protein Desaci_4440 [Desulfosporosinus acidiphilus SJ4]|uniref:Uncharacterized protein n=1 Tax=Desulfosporosinus acidiphilus (strain DSM 22704 / JCM 16185 / SJ4) TaxID=646529 RepID=I4DBV9_DESAJ|nr:hypothetical protein [Desulfosporosinus acidiphilus]AFM43283.1 hypothetical protein Desaci_4440 [Desulfosporosinus acidiphilus SJ4]